MGVLVLCDPGQVTCLLYDAVSFFAGSLKFKKKKKWLYSPSLFLNSFLDLEKSAKTPQSNPLLLQISFPGYLLF